MFYNSYLLVKNKKLFKVFDYEFYLSKEYETKVTKKKYSEEEALKELEKQIKEKLLIKGSNISNIIDQKVLKKSVNNSFFNVLF